MTIPLKVDNANFLLERLAADCAPNQYIRELTQNSIESILKTVEREGRVVWDVDWDYLEATGKYKAAISDTGCGMSLPDLRRYTNHLSSSGNVQALDRNYGLGAKVAAGSRNHLGMMYTSLVEGATTAYQVTFHRDRQGNYGLQQYVYEDGTHDYHDERAVGDLPEIMQGAARGTQVTLLGNTEDEVTYPHDSVWFLMGYINQRYFRFPKGTTVWARQFPSKVAEWPKSRSDADAGRNQLRQIHGQKHYLDEDAAANGRHDIGGAIVHWWIMKEELRSRPMARTRGHVAALYQDELYEIGTKKRDLYRFGIWHAKAANLVVLYVQPKNLPGQTIIPTASRNTLRVNDENNPLPWDEWAAEFMKNMPKELDDFVSSFGDAAHSDSDKIHEEMEKHKHLYELQAYQFSRKTKVFKGEADENGEDEVVVEFPSDHTKTGRRPPGPRPPGPKPGVGVRRARGRRTEEDTLEAKRLDFPKVVWVSMDDGSRNAGDELEDRSALYINTAHTLHINIDFRLVKDIKKKFAEQWNPTNNPEISAIIEREVHNAYELILTETVVGVRGLQGSARWTPEDLFEKALSPEALTAAVQCRVSIWNRVHRKIGTHAARIKRVVMAEAQDADA
jgi:hypothetical protein